MRKYNIPPAFSSSLQLGRQGENGVTEITFLCAGYAKMYGDGFAEAVHRTPDGTTYPVNIEQDENNRVSWLISDGDTSTAGTGQLELRWMVNGNIAKSKIFSTIIKSALTAPETPPDAAKSWVDKVLKAAEDIKAGAIDDEKLAKAIAEYLEKHPIESGITEQKAREIAQSIVDSYQEKDPTVPDWAKAETKPTYTAAEVGAVPESSKSDIDKNTSARHTHSNKSALDAITAEDIVKWNSGTAGTVEITGATGLAAGSAPTVTETADSTARARQYQLGIPAGKDGADGAKGDKGDKGDKGATGAKGDKGERGEQGAKGDTGADGKSAYQFAQEAGYTGTETEFGAKLNQTTFANPFPLTFTGAASATYDGSSAVTVDLPSGSTAHEEWELLIDETDVEITETVQAIVLPLPSNRRLKKVRMYMLLSRSNTDPISITVITINNVRVNTLMYSNRDKKIHMFLTVENDGFCTATRALSSVSLYGNVITTHTMLTGAFNHDCDGKINIPVGFAGKYTIKAYGVYE